MRPQRLPPPCFNGLPSLPNDLLTRASRAAAAAALCAALSTGTLVHAPASTRAAVAPVTTERLPAPQLDAEHALAQEAWTLVSRYYRDGGFGGASWGRQGAELQRAVLQTRPSTYRAIRSALSVLGDPYTRLLTPSEMAGLRKFDVSGVGLLLTAGADGGIVVATDPLPGTAAAEARILRGDVLLSVDGADVSERAAFEVAQLMQGEDGGELALRFRDAGDVALRRNFGGGKRERASATSFLAEEDGRLVGHMQLSEFTASSRVDVARAVHELRALGADAFVLDVRGNPGGVFEGALEIAGIFEGADVPVAKVSGRGEAETFTSSVVGDAEGVDNVPLAIVVDARSASASEVLAGGLRDVCRAAVVGDSNSYGKGLIQGVFGLSDGSGLVLTVAEYETPKGVSIQGKGLVPDFPLNESFVDKALHGFGVYGPARVDWERVQAVTEECRRAF